MVTSTELTLTALEIQRWRSLGEFEREAQLRLIEDELGEAAAVSIRSQIDGQWILDNEELANHFGVGLRSINTWKQQGMPQISPGGRKTKPLYDLRECAKWLAMWASKKIPATTNQSIREQEASATYREQKAELEKLKRLRLEGSLVDVEMHDRRMMDVIHLIRTGVKSFHRAHGNAAMEQLTQLIDEAEAAYKQEIGHGDNAHEHSAA